MLSRNLVYSAVALAGVLGSRTAEMLVTQSLLIHGPRAFRLAKVGCGVTECCVVHRGGYRAFENYCLADHHAWHSDHLTKTTIWLRTSVSVFSFMLSPHSPVDIPATTSLSAVSRTRGCLKCGSGRKLGVLSCCARGGTWFKKCGDARDTEFDHTWAEGIKACKSFTTAIKSSVDVKLPHGGAIVYPPNTTHVQNYIQQQTNIERLRSICNTGTTDSKGRVGFAKVIFCIYIFIL